MPRRWRSATWAPDSSGAPRDDLTRRTAACPRATRPFDRHSAARRQAAAATRPAPRARTVLMTPSIDVPHGDADHDDDDDRHDHLAGVAPRPAHRLEHLGVDELPGGEQPHRRHRERDVQHEVRGGEPPVPAPRVDRDREQHLEHDEHEEVRDPEASTGRGRAAGSPRARRPTAARTAARRSPAAKTPRNTSDAMSSPRRRGPAELGQLREACRASTRGRRRLARRALEHEREHERGPEPEVHGDGDAPPRSRCR